MPFSKLAFGWQCYPLPSSFLFDSVTDVRGRFILHKLSGALAPLQHASLSDTLQCTVVGVIGELQRTGRFLQEEFDHNAPSLRYLLFIHHSSNSLTGLGLQSLQVVRLLRSTACLHTNSRHNAHLFFIHNFCNIYQFRTDLSAKHRCGTLFTANM
ncbi:hypothetical protein AVEN_93565-1 [Araneus ventricosus]|uniref:Uncharacterized protein n=1 Tax=Araneus ventricosus TaxID=182803 RepID=A0A4Y2APY6_ARAVE|nr:hypothetical protein AVEN_93565-1 [Araneus ventricosus]